MPTIAKPQLPLLNLDLQKTTVFVAKPFKMTQGDKGYQQPFKLTNAFAKYDVEPGNLCWSATKPDGKIIDVTDEPDRFHLDGTTWYFDLPDEAAEAIGNVTGYFYVKDDQQNIIASTTKFGYEVTAKFGEDGPSNNYVSELTRLEQQFQDYIENAKNQINLFNDWSNDAKKQLTDLLDQLQKQTNKWLTDKTTEVDQSIKQRTDALDELQARFNTEYNAQVKKYNDKFIEIGNDWSKQSGDIDKAYKKQFDDNQQAANEAKDAAIKSINQAWQAQQEQLTQDMAAFKEGLQKSVQQASDNITEINETEIPTIKATLKTVSDHISDFNSEDFVKKADIYSKQEIDDKLAAAGKVKTVSLNGGDKVAPDDSGNIDVTVPKPDLSGYAQTADIMPKLEAAASKATAAQTAATQAQSAADNAATAAGTAQTTADGAKTAADKAQKDINDTKITVSSNTAQINAINASISQLQVAKHFTDASAAQTYSAAHPTTVCIVDS